MSFTRFSDRLLRFAISLAAGWFWCSLCLQGAAQDLLWQTNAGGNDIHIFDASSGQLIARPIVGENPHGLAWAPNGETVFVTLEKNGSKSGELLWINRKTFEIEHRLEVGREPHAIAITPDGNWVYVPCKDGHYWVVDTKKKSVVTKIFTGGRPHNTSAASNDLVLLSPMSGGGTVTLVDPSRDHSVLGVIKFTDSVRPPALDVSRGKFFQHVDGLNGFEVADLESQKVTDRVKHSRWLGLPILPGSWGRLGARGMNRCHGLGTRPGNRQIWSVCGRYLSVHDITESGHPEIGSIKLPSKGYWLTFSADGSRVYVALSDAGEVAVIDTDKIQLLTRWTAGDKPKRNLVIPKDGLREEIVAG